MPNKTIYVSDGDLGIYQRAQEIAGGNLSSAIASALRRYVDIEESRKEGFEEITVKVGPAPGHKVRFVGVLLGEWMDTSPNRVETYRVYRGRTGKFVLYVDRTPDFAIFDKEGKPGGWRANLGLDWNASYRMSPGGATLEVIESIDDLFLKIPEQLYDMVAASARQPIVEDLDI